MSNDIFCTIIEKNDLQERKHELLSVNITISAFNFKK